MSKLLWHTLLACATLPFAALAVQEGQTYEQVVAEKGEPSSRISLGDTLVLSYPDETIKLKAGQVVSVKSVDANAVSVIPSAAITPGAWTTDYAGALAYARQEGRQVFLLFTGSDWCSWCKRLDREVLSTREFIDYAKEKLVLVKLDFPRGFSLSAELQAQNEQLSQHYKVRGFPTVVVLNKKGKRVGELGYQEGGPSAFIRALDDL
jgi:protein disulfide-isomerase